MTKYNYFLVMLICYVWWACVRDKNDIYFKTRPIAAFKVQNDNCDAPCEITFTNTSSGGYTENYIWDFGDGDTVHSFDARHTYREFGSYNVTLKARNNIGETFSEQVVNIKQKVKILYFTYCRMDYVIIYGIPTHKPDGKPWDIATNEDSLPDLKWHIRAGKHYFDQSDDLPTARNIQGASFPFKLSRQSAFAPITKFDDTYTLYLLDDDGATSDTIGIMNFRPDDYTPPPRQNENEPLNTSVVASHQLKPAGILQTWLKWN